MHIFCHCLETAAESPPTEPSTGAGQESMEEGDNPESSEPQEAKSFKCDE